MSRLFTASYVVALLAIFTLPSLAGAQVLADRVPADTAIYVGWQGVDPSAPGYAGSHLQEFLADSQIPALADDVLPKVLDRIAKQDKDSAEAVEVIRTVIAPMWRHPTAIAFVGIDIDPKTGPRPKMLILCQAGNEAAALKAKADDLLKQAGPAPFPVKLIEKGDLLALVIGYDQAETAIPDANGQSLANNPDFVKSLAQVSKGAFFTAYFDVDAILKMADTGTAMAGPEIKANWEKSRDMLGLKGLHRAIVTEGFDGKDWGSQAFVAAPAPRSGFIGSLLNGKALSKDLLAAIPENSTMAGATHFDLGGLVTAIRSAVEAFDADSAKQIDSGIEEANKTVGMDIQKDLLGNLGDEWAYYVDPTVAGSNGMVGATLLNKLKDPEKAEAAILKLQDFIDKYAESQLKDEKITIAFRQSKIDNVTVHYLGLPLVTPAWAVQDGILCVGLYPEVVATAANQIANKGKSIASNPAFIALADKLGDHPVSSFSFVDVPRRAPENYASWLVISHLAQASDLFGVPAPARILPPLPKLLKHLSAAGQIAWSEDDGFHAKGISAFPGSVVFASDQSLMSMYEESMMGALFMYPMSMGIPHVAIPAPAVEDKAANLKHIAAAAIKYSNAHNGKYPATLGELYEGSGLTLGAFVNPAHGVAAPTDLKGDQAKEWIDENSDYVWNGAGKDTTIGVDQPLAWENPAKSQGDGILILYGDYHTEFKTLADATAIIAKAKAK
ncbi:MAG TPA: DUF3352 domain-containing protein [Tepidisphaeraceae bacterium]|jgi:hypothetical protein|nr:DUF3352 domain-containing protein [Tepidisphaeraceae bacterium]